MMIKQTDKQAELANWIESLKDGPKDEQALKAMHSLAVALGMVADDK